MKRALAIAVLLGAVVASAEPPKKTETPARPESPAEPQGPVNVTGAFVSVGVTDSSQLTQPTNNFNNSSTFSVLLPALTPTIRAGAMANGRDELSVGVAFAFANANQFNGSNAQYDLILAPTYALHFAPLRPWALSPFVQLAIAVGFTNQLTNSGPNHDVIQLGTSAGVGGEYLFGDRLGFIVIGGVRFVAFGLSGTVFGSGVTNEVGFQVWGSAAVSLHF